MILLTTFQVWESHTRSLIPSSSWKMGIFLAAGHPDSQMKRSDVHTSLTPQSWPCTPSKALREGRKPVFPEHPTVCQGPYQQLCLHIAFNPHHKLLIALLCQWGNRGSEICDELLKLTALAEGTASTSNQDPCHFSLFGLFPPSALHRVHGETLVMTCWWVDRWVWACDVNACGSHSFTSDPPGGLWS